LIFGIAYRSCGSNSFVTFMFFLSLRPSGTNIPFRSFFFLSVVVLLLFSLKWLLFSPFPLPSRNADCPSFLSLERKRLKGVFPVFFFFLDMGVVFFCCWCCRGICLPTPFFPPPPALSAPLFLRLQSVNQISPYQGPLPLRVEGVSPFLFFLFSPII